MTLTFAKKKHSLMLLMLMSSAFVCDGRNCAVQAADWIPKDNQVLLETLRAKDAQFDNLSIKYEKRLKHTIHPLAEWAKQSQRAAEAGLEPPPVPNDESLEAYDVEVVSHERLTIRGPETTFDIRWLTDNSGKPHGNSKTITSKTSNTTGVQQNLTDLGDISIFHDDTRPPPSHGLQEEDRMLVEFCFGVGYGKRIVSIDCITPQGEFANIEATMRLSSHDVTKANLRIDNHYLVRDATLLADARGSQTRLEIISDGPDNSTPGLELLHTGHLKRTALIPVKGELPETLDRLVAEYDLTVLEIERNLAPEEYDRLVSIDSSSANYRVDKTPRQPSPRPKNRSSNSFWFLSINTVVVVVLAVIIARKKLMAASS